MWGIFIVNNAIIAGLLVYKLMNHYQLDGYRFCNNMNVISWDLYMMIAGLLGVLIAQLTLQYCGDRNGYFASAIALILPIGLIGISMIEPKKTPLKFTKRVARLYAINIILSISVNLILALIAICCSMANELMLSPLTFALLPFSFHLSCLIAIPIEKLIQKKFIKECKKNLKNRKIIKIGITGSYAKTSVKGIVEKMLSRKYNVIATPYSYNTPMGICISVKNITDETEVFIAEMGARHKGDIELLCDIVQPSIGILTGIAPTHLDTFKAMSTLIDTKYELIESLPSDGKAFFNGDNNEVSRMFNRCHLREKYLVKYGSGIVHLENVVAGSEGSSFDLVIGEERTTCRTILLGAHNLSNIALGAALAHSLDVNISDIQIAIGELDYQPHRLQLIKTKGGITIIDDSYNCNIEGAKCAINTISLFPNRKVVLTQGAVEMGVLEEEVNYKIGLMMSQVADLAIVVGRRGLTIARGLLDGGCNPTKIVEFKTLKIATENLGRLLITGDVLLLMNDLPDNYN